MLQIFCYLVNFSAFRLITYFQTTQVNEPFNWFLRAVSFPPAEWDVWRRKTFLWILWNIQTLSQGESEYKLTELSWRQTSGIPGSTSVNLGRKRASKMEINMIKSSLCPTKILKVGKFVCVGFSSQIKLVLQLEWSEFIVVLLSTTQNKMKLCYIWSSTCKNKTFYFIFRKKP